MAYLDGGKLVIRSLDGSRRHWASGDPTIRDFEWSTNGRGGWSPGGRKLLLMKDVGDVSMRAVSVDPPFRSETVVVFAPVNNPRAWPRYGDVSWQPVPSRDRRLAVSG